MVFAQVLLLSNNFSRHSNTSEYYLHSLNFIETIFSTDSSHTHLRNSDLLSDDATSRSLSNIFIHVYVHSDIAGGSKLWTVHRCHDGYQERRDLWTILLPTLHNIFRVFCTTKRLSSLHEMVVSHIVLKIRSRRARLVSSRI
jgi:hypothetical protein